MSQTGVNERSKTRPKSSLGTQQTSVYKQLVGQESSKKGSKMDLKIGGKIPTCRYLLQLHVLSPTHFHRNEEGSDDLAVTCPSCRRGSFLQLHVLSQVHPGTSR
jgi:hypothetical protein